MPGHISDVGKGTAGRPLPRLAVLVPAAELTGGTGGIRWGAEMDSGGRYSGMAEPQSLVRLEAYREARQVATTWWERRDAELLVHGAQGTVPSQEAEADTARLGSVGIDDHPAD